MKRGAIADGAATFSIVLVIFLLDFRVMTGFLQHRLFLLLLVCFSSFHVAAQEGDSSYKLGSGDIINIRVFGEDELTFEEVRLTDTGTISYPFLGEVNAKGKTASELEQIIVRGLKGDYLIDPKVSVRILEYRDFFVNGEVTKPGGYPYSPGLTIRKAVALAGGFTEWASKNSIQLIRESDPSGKPVNVSLDTPVMPGDIITISQSLF